MGILVGLFVLAILAGGAVLVALVIRALIGAVQPDLGAQIVARYRGTCVACGLAVEPGMQIFFRRGHPIRHVDCVGAERVRLAYFIDKIGSAKGPATRRNALAAGLSELRHDVIKQELMLAASRIEVESVIDKVEALKSPAVKRRRLEEALAALRADTVPDELQKQQIEWLEAELKKLDAA